MCIVGKKYKHARALHALVKHPPGLPATTKRYFRLCPLPPPHCLLPPPAAWLAATAACQRAACRCRPAWQYWQVLAAGVLQPEQQQQQQQHHPSLLLLQSRLGYTGSGRAALHLPAFLHQWRQTLLRRRHQVLKMWIGAGRRTHRLLLQALPAARCR